MGVGRLDFARNYPQHLTKNDLKPWLKQAWCIPEVGAAFVAAMEDVLDLYAEPYAVQQPVVCVDETSKQLIKDTRSALPPCPGQVERVDYEYERNGTRNLFMMVEPLAAWRHVEVTQQRTKVDFAHIMQYLVDEVYPQATCSRVVLDNLNTHCPAALYEAFPPEQARRLLKKLEFHYTPKHGSWPNMAELELGVFSRQCLDRYMPDEAFLKQEVKALELERNGALAKIRWRFTTSEARTKLKRLYPLNSCG
jgi:hypothetical protein